MVNLKCIILNERGKFKRLHTVWCYLYGILEEEKLYVEKTDQWLPEVRGKVGLDFKWAWGDFEE